MLEFSQAIHSSAVLGLRGEELSELKLLNEVVIGKKIGADVRQHCAFESKVALQGRKHT